ncbi:lipocalin family protein [Pedobacter sp. B4-66]|uniref:lipocalin family protein n=1 Tax=Pedobacter sp. B4-66 TaxID=2817280 RepID=UPI001BDA2F7A|nr:lipocalin family protein [Pedobacter sp. B4-66]
MMKKFTLFILIVAIFTITGCKKDQENDKENPNTIVARWIASSILEITYKNGKEIRRDNDTQNNLMVEFKSDGTGTSQRDDESANFTYTLKDGKLIFKTEGEFDEYKIKSLTNSELELYQEESETEDGMDYKYIVEIKLKKQ